MSMFRIASPSPEALVVASRQSWRWLFGRMIGHPRLDLGRSVQQTAQLAGMESSEWAAVEAGYVPADPGRLRSMAAAIEISWESMATLVLICREGWES